MADTTTVHAPAPAATASSTHEVHLVRPSTGNVSLRLTTVHNWVELVYNAFGFSIPTGKTELAMLGVREASLSGKGGVDTLEKEAADGDTDHATFTREDRSSNLAAAPTTYNDLLFLVFTDKDVADTQHVEVFECTIDAGAFESSLGIPITLEGKQYHACPGPHLSNKYPGNDVALHLFTGSAEGHMMLAREATKKYRSFVDIQSAKNAATHWKFASNEENSSIHMHFGSEAGTVGAWSTGCTVLHHHYWLPGKGVRKPDPKATRYKRFMEIYKGAANKKQIPYLVVSSKYVRLYPEWVRLLHDKPTDPITPKTVILEDELRAPKAYPGRYVPSFMSKPFADDVTALADAKTTDPTRAANLRSSLELCLLDPKI